MIFKAEREPASGIRHAPRRAKGTRHRFLVDGMLGSLAVKLRILGFDAEYDRESTDRELVQRATNEGRILLTSDRELFLLAKHLHTNCMMVQGASERERLVQLFTNLGVKKLSPRRPSRCSLCNGRLQKTQEIDSYGREMYRCNNCGKLYWRGSHWKKLEQLFWEVNRAMSDTTRLVNIAD